MQTAEFKSSHHHGAQPMMTQSSTFNISMASSTVSTPDYSSLFTVTYDTTPSDSLLVKIENALNKLARVVALPQGADKVAIQMNITDEGNNGLLGYAQVNSIQYYSMNFGDVFPSRGTLTLNPYYGISEDTIAHEVLHILGIGPFWTSSSISNIPIDNSENDNRYYLGENALREYKEYYRLAGGDPDKIYGIPVENDGGPGTEGVHLEEGDENQINSQNNRYKNGVHHPGMGHELMSGVGEGYESLSKITIGLLEDIGYTVDYSEADAFSLEILEEDIVQSQNTQNTLIKGDLLNTGTFSLSDYILLRNYINDSNSLIMTNSEKELFLQKADVNDDDVVDNSDVIYMLNTLLENEGYVI